jgi:DNA-binding transcriptional LysR family regulator
LHFRIASENLFITQSAVSARIKLLENDLGVLLFDRSQKHLKLTPEGNRLIKHANELIFMG